MKKMTHYILQQDNSVSLAELMTTELSANKMAVCNYAKDWLSDDIQKIQTILDTEQENIAHILDLHDKKDSVKGEDAMLCVYPNNGLKKATDAITLKDAGTLSLIEAKYLIKFASKGPFGGCGSFKERVSRKFQDMSETMTPDGETIEPLRIILVTEEQLPFSINHVQALVAGDYPPGSFSDDGLQHTYVLCSSSFLRKMIDTPPKTIPDSQDYLFFTL